MTHCSKILLSSLILISLAACAPARFDDAPEYYTRVGFFYERGRHLTTNYQKGNHVSPNTRVRIIERGSNQVRIVLAESGDRVVIENVARQSQKTMDEIFELMFSPEPLDMSQYTGETRMAVKYGRVIIGMTKDEVIAALGYPPGFKTFSLDEDTWRYPINRYVNRIIEFSNGRVALVLKLPAAISD